MTTFFKDPEANAIFHEFIATNFARSAGLMSHEFLVHFDPDLKWNGSTVDYVISCGPCIHVAVRCLPTDPDLKRHLSHAFSQNLRPFLRSKALVRRKDALKWYALAVENPTGKIPRRVKVNAFTREVIVSVKLTDKHSKKSVIVELSDSDLFTAQETAIKLLYGEKL